MVACSCSQKSMYSEGLASDPLIICRYQADFGHLAQIVNHDLNPYLQRYAQSTKAKLLIFQSFEIAYALFCSPKGVVSHGHDGKRSLGNLPQGVQS